MTRKSRKGVVGKAMPSNKRIHKIGPGIDFVKEGLRFGDEIDRAVRKAEEEQGL